MYLQSHNAVQTFRAFLLAGSIANPWQIVAGASSCPSVLLLLSLSFVVLWERLTPVDV